MRAVRKLLLFILIAIAVSAGLAAGTFYAAGPARVWAQFGPADLGDIDFATLKRRDVPNDALACRMEFCAARYDVEPPEFSKPADELYRIAQAAVASEPRLEKVAAADARQTLRYIQRSRIMGFPDTINVKVVPLPDGGSTVLLYSRSQLGRGDMGVNRARIERWLGLIVQEARR